MGNGKVCIIGGGAAGMMAGILLENHRIPVTIVEAQPRVGKKLLSTGNGRCNLTNLHAVPERYHGDIRLIRPVLEAFPPEKTIEFFRGLGLYTVTEDAGRVYPRSQAAASVLDALRLKLEEQGAEILCGNPVTELRQGKNGFTVRLGEEIRRFDAVLLTCGGRAASSADGYAILKNAGIQVTPLVPALCPVPVKEDVLKSLKGLRTGARVTLYADGKPMRELSAEGEVQFADRALSGICVFDLSRWCNLWQEQGTVADHRVRDLRIGLDLLPETENKRALIFELRNALPYRAAEDFLSGLMPKRLGMTLMKCVWDGAMNTPVSEIPDAVLEKLALLAGNWQFTPRGMSAWNQAQVTAGGVTADFVDPRTLEARGVKGLYLAGEMLDADGPCGGFNLQWAWASAAAAVEAIVGKFS